MTRLQKYRGAQSMCWNFIENSCLVFFYALLPVMCLTCVDNLAPPPEKKQDEQGKSLDFVFFLFKYIA